MELPSSFTATSISVFIILGIVTTTLYMPEAKPARGMLYQGETQEQVSNVINKEEEIHAAYRDRVQRSRSHLCN